jgi:hypothetical protein
MRHAIRIQPYLSPDLHQKLRAYAAARSLTVSAVISAALAEYLGRDGVEDGLIMRRLDGVADVVGQLKREIETLAVGFGTFAWHSFLRGPVVADAGVVRQAETQYNAFLNQVAQQVRQGVRFISQVFPTRQSAAPVPESEMGGREKERRS